MKHIKSSSYRLSSSEISIATCAYASPVRLAKSCVYSSSPAGWIPAQRIDPNTCAHLVSPENLEAICSSGNSWVNTLQSRAKNVMPWFSDLSLMHGWRHLPGLQQLLFTARHIKCLVFTVFIHGTLSEQDNPARSILWYHGATGKGDWRHALSKSSDASRNVKWIK